MSWNYSDVNAVAMALVSNLPASAYNMVTSGKWEGGGISRLDSILTSPSAADVALNYNLLLPLLKHSPDRVPLFAILGHALFCIGIGNIFVISGSDGIFPAATPKVPSGFFLTDTVLQMDKIFKGKLLVRKEGEGESARLVDDMRTKFDLASIEGVKFKRLIGAVRTLWRSSPKGNHPHVTHLKSLLRPSPDRQRAPRADVP